MKTGDRQIIARSLAPVQTTATSSRLAPPQGVPLSGLRYFLAKPPRSPKGLEIVPLRAWRLGERLFSGRKLNGRSVPWITLRRRTPPSPRRTRMTTHTKTRCASHLSARTGRACGAMHPCGKTARFGSPHGPFGANWDRLLIPFASPPRRSRPLFRGAGTKRGIQTP